MRVIRRPHHRVTRRIDGVLCTPVHAWRRDDQRITLVGMCHVAEQRYFDYVRALAERAEDEDGAAVHYERIRNNGLHEATSEHERRLLAENRPWYRDLAALTGLAAQSDALPLRPGWSNHDLDKLSVMRGMGMRAAEVVFKRLGEAVPSLTDELTPRQRRRKAASLRRTLLRGPSPGGNLLMRWVLGGNAVNVIEHWRNLYAVTKALAVAHTRPVVLIWGAAHLAGMGDILAANGFVLDDAIDWVEAIRP